MGADLYLEEQRFRSRPNLMYLNKKDNWEVYVDLYYVGYKRRGTIKNTLDTEKALRLFCKPTDTRPI